MKPTGGNGADRERKRFEPPTPAEVRAWVKEKHPGWLEANVFDPLAFCAHYQSVGWYVGKKRMVDWHAAAVGWVVRKEAREP
jgi:hypothetical protein